MTTLIIKSNVNTTANVLVRDLGILIPFGGGSETFTDEPNIQRCQDSGDLYTLCTDDAYNPNGSTLILNDGTSDIPPGDIDDFLVSVPPHAESHKHSGFDQVAAATPAANAIPKAGAAGTLDAGWLPVKNNHTAVTNPSVSDDETQGYSVGSCWVNTVTDDAYICTHAATGAAVWRSVGGPQGDPRHFFGEVLNYTSSGGISTSTVQYVRVFLTAGTVLTKMTTFYRTGGAAGRTIRLGIYDQAVPTSLTGVPVNRVATTASTDSAAWVANTWIEAALTVSYTVPTTGFYWFAMIQSAGQLSWSVTPSFPPNQLPLYFEASAGNTLPAVAGTLTTGYSAVAICGGVE